MKYNLEISHEFYLKVRIMDSNLKSLLTLGIELYPCVPVDMCSLLLCLILSQTLSDITVRNTYLQEDMGIT